MILRPSHPTSGPYRVSVEIAPGDRGRGDRDRALVAELTTILDGANGPVQVWLQEADEASTGLLVGMGLVPYRDLHQLRRSLPAPPSGLITRAFVPGDDTAAFLAVNNRAFAWHPEQAGMTEADLDAAMSEPWFNADGFRLLEIEDRLAGFCWTKVHSDTTPPLGEIYVIAIDPDFHGRGLGSPMSLAGLEWLSAAGLATALLYVEADNAPALAIYDRLGFQQHSTNRAFHTAEPAVPAAEEA